MSAPADRTIYYSKISWPLVLFVSVALLVPLGFMLVNGIWLGVAIVVVSALLPHSIFRNTYYEIKEGELLVTSGFIFKQAVPVHSIRRIRPTHSIMAAPALSLDRQAIEYGTYGSLIISLKDADKSGFYEQLKLINPGIVLG